MKNKLFGANAILLGLFGFCVVAESQELALPRSCTKIPSNCIIKEDKDQEIKITLKGQAKADFAVKVFDPQNQLIKTETVKVGNYAETPAEITIPADKKVGQYLLTLYIGDGKGNFAAPLSSLPEVYLCNNMFVVGKASNSIPLVLSTSKEKFFQVGPEKIEMLVGKK